MRDEFIKSTDNVKRKMQTQPPDFVYFSRHGKPFPASVTNLISFDVKFTRF